MCSQSANARHPRVKFRANLKSISHRCHLCEVAFVWELTSETIHLPQGCLPGFSSHVGTVNAAARLPSRICAQAT